MARALISNKVDPLVLSVRLAPRLPDDPRHAANEIVQAPSPVALISASIASPRLRGSRQGGRITLRGDPRAAEHVVERERGGRECNDE